MSDEPKKANGETAARSRPMDDTEAEAIAGGVGGGDADTNPDGSFESALPEGGSITKGPGAGE